MIGAFADTLEATAQFLVSQKRLPKALTRDDFAFPGLDLQPVVEPGEIRIHVGFCADPAELRSTVLHLS